MEKKHFPHLSKSHEGRLTPRNQTHGPTSIFSTPEKLLKSHPSMQQPQIKTCAELPDHTWPWRGAGSGSGE